MHQQSSPAADTVTDKAPGKRFSIPPLGLRADCSGRLVWTSQYPEHAIQWDSPHQAIEFTDLGPAAAFRNRLMGWEVDPETFFACQGCDRRGGAGPGLVAPAPRRSLTVHLHAVVALCCVVERQDEVAVDRSEGAHYHIDIESALGAQSQGSHGATQATITCQKDSSGRVTLI